MPWQPHAGIAQKLSSRGYATTSWTDESPADFADIGFPPKSSGFSAAHYQPTKQSLSKQAQASLALLEGEFRNDALGGDKSTSAPAEEDPNAHLPFVSDAYAATRKSKLRVQVDPNVLQRALAQAELAESLVVSPITSDEQMAEPIVIHPDVPDVEDEVMDVQAKDVIAEPAPLPEADVAFDAPQAPELPMVAGGISPEEVAQRETEQFEKGLAQARADAAIELAEAVRRATEDALAKGMAQAREEMAAEHAEAVRQATEDAREQALAQGKEEGLAEGLAQGRDEGHAQGLAEGKEQGSSEGEAQVRAELADEMAAQREVFENAAKALHDVLADPKQFFEPVKRLAMHIAEQIVVGELQTSSKGIERLVQRCLDEMDHPVQGAVVLELNPQDKALLQEQAADFTKGMRLEAIHDMPRGSVRVFANDTVIEDLVEHRLEGLAKALLMDVDAWREKSPLAQRILEVQEEVGGDDVHS